MRTFDRQGLHRQDPASRPWRTATAHGRAAHAARLSPLRPGPSTRSSPAGLRPPPPPSGGGRRRLARHARGFSPQLGRLPRTRRRNGKLSAGAALSTGTCSTLPSGALKPSRGQLRRTRWGPSWISTSLGWFPMPTARPSNPPRRSPSSSNASRGGDRRPIFLAVNHRGWPDEGPVLRAHRHTMRLPCLWTFRTESLTSSTPDEGASAGFPPSPGELVMPRTVPCLAPVSSHQQRARSRPRPRSSGRDFASRWDHQIPV